MTRLGPKAGQSSSDARPDRPPHPSPPRHVRISCSVSNALRPVWLGRFGWQSFDESSQVIDSKRFGPLAQLAEQQTLNPFTPRPESQNTPVLLTKTPAPTGPNGSQDGWQYPKRLAVRLAVLRMARQNFPARFPAVTSPPPAAVIPAAGSTPRPEVAPRSGSAGDLQAGRVALPVVQRQLLWPVSRDYSGRFRSTSIEINNDDACGPCGRRLRRPKRGGKRAASTVKHKLNHEPLWLQ